MNSSSEVREREGNLIGLKVSTKRTDTLAVGVADAHTYCKKRLNPFYFRKDVLLSNQSAR